MTAPVSLAEIKARKASLVSGLIGMTEAERDRLVELAEAYLAVREAGLVRPIGGEPRDVEARLARLVRAAQAVRA